LQPAGGDGIDKVGVDEERRMLQHPARDFRLVAGKPEDDGRRGKFAERQRLRQRLAHQRRRIVQQHDQRAFGGGAVVGRQFGIEVGARHRSSCVGALRGACRSHPLQELADDHVSAEAMCRRAARIAFTLDGPQLTIRSP
jgi:hypothetical protein